MIKFRCPHCGQKIAANDDGAGAVIACSTCAETIIVPPVTDAEFAPPSANSPATEPALPVRFELVEPTRCGPRTTERLGVGLRLGLATQLARMMMNRLVQVLLCQRAELLNAQSAATARVVELEKRLAVAQQRLQQRLDACHRRIAELETQLAAKEQQNRQLMQANLALTRKLLEAQQQATRTRVDLRDTGFLLRT